MSRVVMPEVRVGMFLIAPRAYELASWDGADGETKACEENSKHYFADAFSQRAELYEADTRTKKGYIHLHRQMDAQVLLSLKDRPYRHGQLRRQLESVSQRMLTRTLRNLESAGLIARRVTLSKAITVEYSLTKPGRTIIVPHRGMCRWAKRYRKDVSAEVRLGAETA